MSITPSKTKDGANEGSPVAPIMESLIAIDNHLVKPDRDPKSKHRLLCINHRTLNKESNCTKAFLAQKYKVGVNPCDYIVPTGQHCTTCTPVTEAEAEFLSDRYKGYRMIPEKKERRWKDVVCYFPRTKDKASMVTCPHCEKDINIKYDCETACYVHIDKCLCFNEQNCIYNGFLNKKGTYTLSDSVRDGLLGFSSNEESE